MAKDQGLNEYKAFSGTISANAQSLKLEFRVRIDASGEVDIDFGTIPLTNESWFIKRHWIGDGSSFGLFRISGISEDQTEFETEDVYFTTDGGEFNQELGDRMRPRGGCSSSQFRRHQATPYDKPQLRVHLKGLESRRMHATCALGDVVLTGSIRINSDEIDAISGHVSIVATDECLDAIAWRQKANDLLDHVRLVMSFASSSSLGAPVVEFRNKNTLEIRTYSQSKQTPISMRTFHCLDQQAIFEAAVASAFNPAIKMKKFIFAIDWFSMDASHSEVRLVNAMTALENLVSSNLEDFDLQIRPAKEFEKYRRTLRKVILQCAEKWSTGGQETVQEISAELNERLADLNRRSLLSKLYLLAERWNVPLNNIEREQIGRAKRARDLIVHRGHYYDEKKYLDDLWVHVTVIREVVVRFILSAIEYKGRYLSHLGGCHDAIFPPAEPAQDEASFAR